VTQSFLSYWKATPKILVTGNAIFEGLNINITKTSHSKNHKPFNYRHQKEGLGTLLSELFVGHREKDPPKRHSTRQWKIEFCN
jgi:hypothetical protein